MSPSRVKNAIWLMRATRIAPTKIPSIRISHEAIQSVVNEPADDDLRWARGPAAAARGNAAAAIGFSGSALRQYHLCKLGAWRLRAPGRGPCGGVERSRSSLQGH